MSINILIFYPIHLWYFALTFDKWHMYPIKSTQKVILKIIFFKTLKRINITVHSIVQQYAIFHLKHRNRSLNFYPSMWQETIEDIDKNGDGKIDLQEYIGKLLQRFPGMEKNIH